MRIYYIKSILSIIFFLFFWSLSNSQNICTDTAFRKKYVASVGTTSASQIVLNNSDILINSFSSFPVDSLNRSVISRVKKDGSIIWSKQLSQNNPQDGIYIQQTEEMANGDLVLIGEYINNLNNALYQRKYLFLSKLNSSGNILWSKVFILPISFDSKPTIAIQSLAVDDVTSNFYISLYTPSEDLNNDNGIAAFSPSGNLIWFKHFIYPINNSPDSIELVSFKGLQIIGNDLVCLGYGSVFGNDYQSILLTHTINKLNGAILSSKIYERHLDSIVKNGGFSISPNSLTQNSRKINNSIYLFGSTNETSLQSGLVVKFDNRGNFLSGKNFIAKQFQDSLTSKITRLYISDNEDIISLKRGRYITDANLYFTVFDSSLNILQKQKITRPNNSEFGFGNRNISCDLNNNYFNIFVNYGIGIRPTVSAYFEFNKIFIGQQANISCFGSDGISDTITNMIVTELTNVSVLEYDDFMSYLSPAGLGLANNLSLEDVCITASKCDRIKIVGSPKICNTDSVNVYVAKKRGDCFKVINWSIDTAAYSFFNVLNDSTLQIKFKVNWQGKLYASIGNCNIKDSFNIEVKYSASTINLGTDKVLCNGDSVVLTAPTGFKNFHWYDNTNTLFKKIKFPGTYFLSATSFCNQVITDTITLIPASYNLSAGLDTFRCNNDTITLTATAGFTNYEWQPNTKISNQYSMIASVYPSSEIDYNVTALSPDGCILKDTVKVTYKSTPPLQLGDDRKICLGQACILNAGNTFSSFLWNTGSQNQLISVFKSGNYFVRAFAQNGCMVSDSIYVNVLDTPKNFIAKENEFCLNEKIILQPFTQNYLSFLWSNGSTNSNIEVSNAGEYSLQLTDGNNCTGKTYINVIEKDCRKLIFFPSAFTPNGDNKNEIFKPSVFGTLSSFEIEIYNRFGDLIFKSNNPFKGWNGFYKGLSQPNGTYVWLCKYSFNREIKFEKGSLLLLR